MERSPVVDQLYTTSLVPPSPVANARPSNPTPIAAKSQSTPVKSAPKAATDSQPSSYKPRSNFVKQALESSRPSRPNGVRAPSPPHQRPAMMNAYAKDITAADDWEDTPAPLIYARELGNLDSEGWDDGPELDAVGPPTPVSTPAKKVVVKKISGMPATPSTVPSGSGRTTRGARGRVPAS